MKVKAAINPQKLLPHRHKKLSSKAKSSHKWNASTYVSTDGQTAYIAVLYIYCAKETTTKLNWFHFPMHQITCLEVLLKIFADNASHNQLPLIILSD